MIALASLLSTLLLPPPQEPPEVVAEYSLHGTPAVVTRTDLAIEMAFHLRRRERGKEAVEHIVDTTLTRRAAARKNLLPSDAEVRGFWDDLQKQLRAAGREPSEVAAVRNTGEKQWLEDLAVQMAQERVVRAELGLDRKERVSGEMMKLWLQEERKKARITSAPDQLPAGCAVRIDDTDVPLIDLGMLLLRTSEDDERDRFVNQVAYLNCIEQLGRTEKVELCAADLDAALQRRRDDATRDPRYRGASFESMLEAQGLTVASLRELRVFRAQVLLDKLALQRFPDGALLAELVRDRAAVLDLVGPRRRLGVIFLNAMTEPNAIVKRDFPAAMEHIQTLRKLLEKETFANVAALESEHGPSRQHGGDIGWYRRRHEKLAEPLLAAAFALPLDGVSEPIRGEEGCYLLKVLEIEPEPSDAVLLQRLREQRAKELSQKLLTDAGVRIHGPAGKDPK